MCGSHLSSRKVQINTCTKLHVATGWVFLAIGWYSLSPDGYILHPDGSIQRCAGGVVMSMSDSQAGGHQLESHYSLNTSLKCFIFLSHNFITVHRHKILISCMVNVSFLKINYLFKIITQCSWDLDGYTCTHLSSAVRFEEIVNLEIKMLKLIDARLQILQKYII